MKIKILFFGILADKAGVSEQEMETTGTIGDLKAAIIEKYPVIASLRYSLSLNRALIADDSLKLSDGDEIALLPPFAGG